MISIEERRKRLEEEVARLKEALAAGKRVLIRDDVVKDIEVVPTARSWYVLLRYEDGTIERMPVSRFLALKKRIA